jgi:hypothetical protein
MIVLVGIDSIRDKDSELAVRVQVAAIVARGGGSERCYNIQSVNFTVKCRSVRAELSALGVRRGYQPRLQEALGCYSSEQSVCFDCKPLVSSSSMRLS